MMAMARGHPVGKGSEEERDSIAALWAGPPRKKQAITKTRKAPVFIAAVESCAPRPHLIPRHCKTPNPQIMAMEMISTFVVPARIGKRWPLYSAITMPTAAAVPPVENPSLQPTMKPAESPSAGPGKLYLPPLQGIAA